MMNKKLAALFPRIIIVVLVAAFLWFHGDSLQKYLNIGKENKKDWLAATRAQAASQENYPKLFNMYLRNDLSGAGIVEALKNWDYVALSNRAPASDLSRLKTANPNIKIGRYFTPVSITNGASEFPWSYDKDLYNKISASNWWMHDLDGGTIVTFGSRTDQYYSLGMNFTRYAPTDVNGQRFYDWFPQYVYDRIVKGMSADFLFADETYSGYSWLNNANDNKPIDIDNDGVADSSAKIDEATAEGIRLIMTKLRQILNANGYSNLVIVANGIQPASPYADYFNGTMREAFPFMHGKVDPSPNPSSYRWKDNMFNQDFGYLATEKSMKSPNFSLIGGDSGYTSGQDPINHPNNPAFNQKVRFMLASTLLGDGYFGFAGWWNIAWWISDYFTYNGQKGYLGTPEGNYSQIITESKQGSNYGVYQRKFTKGLVLVNASGYSQSVNIGEAYKKVPEETAVSGATTIPAWDALILVKATCGEGKATSTCWCGNETLNSGQWCCSGQPKAVCTSNSDCGSGKTCSKPNSCEAQCLEAKKPPTNANTNINVNKNTNTNANANINKNTNANVNKNTNTNANANTNEQRQAPPANTNEQKQTPTPRLPETKPKTKTPGQPSTPQCSNHPECSSPNQKICSPETILPMNTYICVDVNNDGCLEKRFLEQCSGQLPYCNAGRCSAERSFFGSAIGPAGAEEGGSPLFAISDFLQNNLGIVIIAGIVGLFLFYFIFYLLFLFFK